MQHLSKLAEGVCNVRTEKSCRSCGHDAIRLCFGKRGLLIVVGDKYLQAATNYGKASKCLALVDEGLKFGIFGREMAVEICQHRPAEMSAAVQGFGVRVAVIHGR